MPRTPLVPRTRPSALAGFALLLSLALGVPALAASWRGVEPGVTTRTEVLSRFQEPSETLKPGDKDVLVYRDGRRIKGTRQVKFRVDRATGIVDRIDVFPTVEIDRDAVESTYGGPCPGGVAANTCYLAKITEDNRIYFHYPGQGVGVFFRPNGRNVFAFAYIVAEPVPGPGVAGAQVPEGTGTETSTPSKDAGEPGADATATGTDWADAAGFGDATEASWGLSGVETSALTDKLQIGGTVFFQGDLGAVSERGVGARLGSASAPMLVDLYLDGRPNDRVRGMVVTRLLYDPTLGADGASALAGGPGGGPSGATNPSLALDQLWLKFDLGRAVYLTIGRQHAKWGSSKIWNTVDFLLPQRLDPLALFDQRLGNDMVKFHLPVEALGMNLYAVGFVTATGGDQPRLRGGAAVRAEVVLGDGEYALSARAEQDRPGQLGLDFSTALGPVDVHGELATRFKPDRRLWRKVDGSGEGGIAAGYEQVVPARGPFGFPHAVLGVTYLHKLNDDENLSFTAEGYFNELGYTDRSLVPWLLANGDLPFFYAGRLYAGLIANYTAGGAGSPWNLTALMLGNLSDGSATARLAGSWTVLNDLSVGAYVQTGIGRPGGEFRLGGALLLPPTGPGTDFTPIETPVPLINAGVTFSVRI